MRGWVEDDFTGGGVSTLLLFELAPYTSPSSQLCSWISPK